MHVFYIKDVTIERNYLLYCRKKRGPMAKIMRITNKGSWLLVLLLLGFVWHLHSHKKTLHEELSTHKDEKEGLLQQLGHLDSTVAERTKSLQESQRLHSQVSSMAHQVRCSMRHAHCSYGCMKFALFKRKGFLNPLPTC